MNKQRLLWSVLKEKAPSLLRLSDYHRYAYNLLNFGLIGDSVRIDASSACQLKCPLCMTNKKHGIVGTGYLKFSDFKRFVDRHPTVKNVELSNWGEIFLNPELSNIIKYSYQKKIRLTAKTGVNLNDANESVLKVLIQYRFRHLIVSIDGATEKTYRIYRKNGSLRKVIANIEQMNTFKKKYNSQYPKMVWQFILFGHNQHEIGLARSMAKKLGMEFSLKLNYDQSYSPVDKKNLDNLPYNSRSEYEKSKGLYYIFACHHLLFEPQINWDGRLLGCSINRSVDFGNVFTQGLKKCLANPDYRKRRKNIFAGPNEKKQSCPGCPVIK